MYKKIFKHRVKQAVKPVVLLSLRLATRQPLLRRLGNGLLQVFPALRQRLRRLAAHHGLLPEAAGPSLPPVRPCPPARPLAPLPESVRWRIEGPFDSTYSLALLNRETALALAALGHQVALHSTEGGGDFPPDPIFLQAHPELAALHAKTAEITPENAAVTSRNLYPPRVADLHSPINLLHHYAWEESGFPAEWIADFNRHLQGMTCLSRHVQKIMIDNGLAIPASTSGCGVDHWERIVPEASRPLAARTFRFLHVSSCFPRKGVDVLLQAYGEAFTGQDDVSLVIKTFANPHNEIHAWLAAARAAHPDYPDVVIIEGDLSGAALKGLYAQCQALVAPSRAEGFGLPLAEAMLSGLPVITTAWGGQLDFCTPETAWLVDYRFAPAQSHFQLFNSVWAEPDRADLARTLREVHDMPVARRQARAAAGRQLLLQQARWQDVAARLVAQARNIVAQSATGRTPPKIGWVSTWNTRCGIAAHSEHFVRCMMETDDVVVFAPRTDPAALTAADGPEVMRCWEIGEHDSLEELAAQVVATGIDVLVIQFNYGFFNFPALGRFLHQQAEQGRKVIFVLHATVDPANAPHKKLADLCPALAACSRLLVHGINDLNRLKALGLVDNVTLFPLGIIDHVRHAVMPANPVFTVASYGFFLPHKGLPELIEAIAILRRQGRAIRLQMVNAEYPVPESAQMVVAARQRISELGLTDSIEVESRFLDNDEILARLERADLMVFPYQNTGESASSAVRYGLVAGVPVAVTPLAIFDDVDAAVCRLPGCDPAAIAAGIATLMDELAAKSPAVQARQQAAERWCAAHRYSGLARRLLGMAAGLCREQH